MALYPYFPGVTPATAATLPPSGPNGYYVPKASWNQLMDNFVNWKFPVDGGGNPLNNLGDLTFSAGKRIAVESWTTVAPANGWANYGSGLPVLKARRTKTGDVQVLGVLAPGSGSIANGTIIATLPVALRPSSTRQLVVIADSVAAGRMAQINITASGEISVVSLALGVSYVAINETFPVDG